MKKRKGNSNKIKPPGRKRKIVITIILSLSLLFGKARLSSSQSPNSNFDNQIIHERVINDRDLNSFEDNDRQVILAKAEGNPVTPPTNRGPSNFPTPPSGGRPSRPVYVPKYRTVPKVVNPGLGPGGGGVELLNLMIIVLFQKTNNHKNQKLLIMILIQMKKRKRSEETRT
nr:hypothetical protein [Haslea silbo]